MTPSPELPPLKARPPPEVPVETLLAVGVVVLTASDVPPGTLREFYERILGLVFVSADPDGLRFRHGQRQVVLERGRGDPGRLGLLIQNFGEALLSLRIRNIQYELLHTDGGLSRLAITRDPAGNWIHLIETRAF